MRKISSEDSSDSSHRKSFDVSLIASNLQQLHEHVTRTLERIEITRPGTDERAVLISKRELESLERALEILSDTEEVRELSAKIAHLAAVTGPLASTLDA
jgi:PHD/YefM family antitoxin component YafN of YafNO toxin-antitoxin module